MTHDTNSERPQPPFPDQHQAKPGLEANMDPHPQYEARAYKHAGKLIDLAALITGGDSGIGRAVALLYAREGADVAIVYLPAERRDAEETAYARPRRRSTVPVHPGRRDGPIVL